MKNKILFAILLIFGNNLSATVIAHFRGQFGNQLFQAAAAISLAMDNDCGVCFPDFFFLDREVKAKGLRENHAYLFHRIPNQMPNRPPKFVYREPNIGCVNYYPIPYQPDIEIDGYFLSEKYFFNHRNLIKQLFSAPEEVEKDLQKNFDWIIDHPKTVGVHVRTGYPDYSTCEKFDPNFYSRYLRPDLEYYKKAIEQFDADSLFVVFSDHIDWCKKHFSSIDRKFIFINNQDYIHDFYLLTHCKHAIIANSAFGWWGAYLNNNPEKKIFCRVPFFIYPNEKTEDLLCEGWIGIPSSNDIPFPEF